MIIKDLIENRLGFLSHLIPLSYMISITNRKIILPFYHAISDTRLPHISNLYSIRSIDLFIKDLEYFCKFYKPISADELFQIVVEKKHVNNPVFHLTFDDGLKQIYSEIAPILEEKGIPATFFLNTNFVDNKDLFFRYKISLIIEFINNHTIDNELNKISLILTKPVKNKQDVIFKLFQLNSFAQKKIDEIAKLLNINFHDFLQNYQPYLKSSEINDLLKKGFTIGSHSAEHLYFKNLKTEEQKRQVSESFNYISAHFGIKNKYFSFPFGDEGVTAFFFEWLYEFEKCRLSFGISGLKDDLYKTHLHRISMENTFDFSDKIIKTEYLYYLLKGLLNKNRIKRHD